MEGVLEFIKSENEQKLRENKNQKYTIPKNFYYVESRELFINPLVMSGNDLNIDVNYK